MKVELGVRDGVSWDWWKLFERKPGEWRTANDGRAGELRENSADDEYGRDGTKFRTCDGGKP
jgi:hypothetical protein